MGRFQKNVKNSSIASILAQVATTSTGGASMSGGHMNGVMNGYGPLASIDGSVIDGSSHHLPPPPPPLPPEGTLGATGVGSGNYAAINNRLEILCIEIYNSLLTFGSFFVL